MWYWQAIWGRYFIGSPHSWASVSWRDQMVNVLSLQPMNWKIPKIPQIPRAILSWKVVNPRTEECGGGGVNPLDPQSCRRNSARGGSRWRWGGLRSDGQPGQPGQSCVHLLPADHRLRGCAHLSRSHPNVLSHVNNLSLFVSSCPMSSGEGDVSRCLQVCHKLGKSPRVRDDSDDHTDSQHWLSGHLASPPKASQEHARPPRCLRNWAKDLAGQGPPTWASSPYLRD